MDENSEIIDILIESSDQYIGVDFIQLLKEKGKTTIFGDANNHKIQWTNPSYIPEVLGGPGGNSYLLPIVQIQLLDAVALLIKPGMILLRVIVASEDCVINLKSELTDFLNLYSNKIIFNSIDSERITLHFPE